MYTRATWNANWCTSSKPSTDADPKPSDELDGGRFFSPEEICRRLGTGFFTPNFEQEWERIQPLLHTETPLTAAL